MDLSNKLRQYAPIRLRLRRSLTDHQLLGVSLKLQSDRLKGLNQTEPTQENIYPEDVSVP